ncbi:NrfD/PsrC family molybdoenzyme membrane anchor subunit [Nocardioides campestrisoli]|uniref:NrfD/PsrC family molybdoenzyme membrane anchor subunit n=1 Tax=Nocardioides campestrisoli TaxID=2736757 RepID=UPI002811BB1F|nr:NrfD/PsrC family molybdoenzyme membrane anchor subunit [Nocardioides campestrisoli]
MTPDQTSDQARGPAGQQDGAGPRFTRTEDEQQTGAVIGSAGGRTTGGSSRRRRPGGRRRHGPGAETMVEEAEFTSYYGRAVVKPAPWELDIPAYLFSGGLAAGTAMIAAAADLTGRPGLRRGSRLGSLAAVAFSGATLVHDLGKPSRFAYMLRVAKLTSPMSVGTWILTAFAPGAGVAGVAEVLDLVPEDRRGRLLGTAHGLSRLVARPANLWAALFGPPLAAYTAVLLSDTATPTWHESYRELPFVFVSSALAASSGWGMIVAPLAEIDPLRRLAIGAALVEIGAERRMEHSLGIAAEPLHEGRAGQLMRASAVLTVAGAAGAAFGGRSRVVSALAGAALMAGSACTRFGIFHAGIESAKDPKYTVLPQRERLEREGPTRHPE